MILNETTAKVGEVGYSDDHRRVMSVCLEYIRSLEQRNLELEKTVKELEEPKTCFGCKWFDELHPSYCDCLYKCARFKHGWDKDYYEQK
jgi:hypothetical protein